MDTGDIVYLKSGGPAMTILDTAGEKAHCAWAVGSRIETQWFPQVMLSAAPPPRPEVETLHDWGEWPPQLTDKLPGDLA